MALQVATWLLGRNDISCSSEQAISERERRDVTCVSLLKGMSGSAYSNITTLTWTRFPSVWWHAATVRISHWNSAHWPSLSLCLSIFFKLQCPLSRSLAAHIYNLQTFSCPIHLLRLLVKWYYDGIMRFWNGSCINRTAMNMSSRKWVILSAALTVLTAVPWKLLWRIYISIKGVIRQQQVRQHAFLN